MKVKALTTAFGKPVKHFVTSVEKPAKKIVRTVEKPAVEVAEKIDSNKQMESLARFGFVVNGALHGLIGIGAIGVALADGNGVVDQSSVLAPLGSSVLGIIILLLMMIGLIMLGFWKLVQITLTKSARIVRTTAYQLEEGFKALVYIVLGFSLVAVIFNHASARASVEASQRFAASVLVTPFGIVLLWIAGLVLVGVGANFIYRGATRRFVRSIDSSVEKIGPAIIVSGIVGYISKGLVFISLGIVAVIAAITSDPSRENGLDGAFKMFFKLPFGAYLLMLVGAGFVCYALYSIARAKYGHFKVKRFKYL